ncbi:MAG: AMP-binding protein [Spirochaetales bacterium]|nr:AMP-binding protein [Spirochaetales bacterium]
MFASLVDIPMSVQRKYPDRVSHRFRSGKSFIDKSYTDFVNDIEIVALGFDFFGIKKESHVSFFVNNRYEWSVIDYSLQTLSAVSVPRGSDTTSIEAEFIYKHSESEYLIIENIQQLSENSNIVNSARKVFIIDEKPIPKDFEHLKDKIFFFKDLLIKGAIIKEFNPNRFTDLLKQIMPETVVSIIYTSGTTGNPKGVVLTQRNFIENVKMTAPRMAIDEEIGEVTVTVLPAWHAFERTFEYSGMSRGLSFVYSSLRFFSEDILREKPHILASVPRLWDSIYLKLNTFMKSQSKFKRKLFFNMVNINYSYKKSLSYLKNCYICYDKQLFIKKVLINIISIFRIILLFPLHIFAEKIFKGVRDKVGGRLRCAISGGGSLPVSIDKFYQSVGINILNAYGMTECSPGIASRSVQKNTLGSVGSPFIDTLIKITNEENIPVKQGEKGLLYVKGPQVMSGYYKNKTATDEVLSSDGWLCTGDLARETIFGDIVLVGRSKDTIVLLGGENVDPLVIEDKIQESEFVDHVMLLGQDKKGLTAFIALNEEALSNFANEVKIKITDIFSFGNSKNKTEEYKILEKKVKEEIDSKITKESGFKPFEKITQVILVKNTFKIGHELTQTLKIKRKQIEETYHSIISKFMDDSDK